MWDDGFLAETDKQVLDLQMGDYIVWKGENVRVENGAGRETLFVSAEMVGKVVMTRKNPLARQLNDEGIPIGASSWALVEFENGMRIVIYPNMAFEKVRMQ